MPRSSGVAKKRTKAAKARNHYVKRCKILQSIENAEDFVPEDAHLQFYENLPEVDLPELCIEVENCAPPILPSLRGNRVVDINYLIEQVRKIGVHDCSCPQGKMLFHTECRVGLISHLTYQCGGCEQKMVVKTQNYNNDLNNSLVWGISSVGGGYSQAEELFSVIDVPIMSKKTYKLKEETLCSKWEELLSQQMHQYAMEEKALAIAAGQIEQGIPYITVIVDGGWAKRSYGHSYSSLSGVACVIGQQTKKLLYIGVKNKFCYVCATNKGEHQCHKNFTGPSTGMEQSIIVEAFNRSECDYGLRYKYVVGDGDSSVYTRILENVSYGRYVIKLECANHTTRAFTANLYKLVKNTEYDPVARNIIKSKISGYSALVRTIIARTPILSNLVADLRNSARHIFGDHNACRKEVCSKQTNTTNNQVPLLESSNIFKEIVKVCDNVIRKADRLSRNVTTNHAERYMSIVAKFTGGKRTNLVQRGVYRNRCIGAGLHFNSGVEFHKMSTKLKKHVLNRFYVRRQKRKTFRKRITNKTKVQQDDMDYGTNPAQPDLSPSEMEIAKTNILADLSKVNFEEIERNTVGQKENINCHQARRNRLTASSFGKICLRRSTTPCHNHLKTLFYRNTDLKTKAVLYGIENEKVAIQKFTQLLEINVADCGLFICKDHCFLGASPDGITSNKELVEVKCLYSIKNLKIKQAAKDNRTLCVTINDNNELMLKQRHHYYFQIQGQLNICQKDYCYLILYTDVDLEYLKIKRDQNFWENIMIPKLLQFWEGCALPELADPRIPRGLNCRDNSK